MGGTPDGQFAHPPEPTAENLAGVLAQVIAAQADVGFCQDPDADRLAIIDEQGRYIGEEYTLAICVDHVLRQRQGPIVTNCSTSRMSEDLAAKYGVPFFRSAVGEANVVDAMLAHDAVFGGEGNGGVIDPRVVLVRDSFVGMALMLDAMAASGSQDQPTGRRIAALRDRQDQDHACRGEDCRRRSTRWKSTLPTPRPTASTACGSTGPASGCWCGPATPSRSCGRLPKRRPRPKPSGCATKRHGFWPDSNFFTGNLTPAKNDLGFELACSEFKLVCGRSRHSLLVRSEHFKTASPGGSPWFDYLAILFRQILRLYGEFLRSVASSSSTRANRS